MSQQLAIFITLFYFLEISKNVTHPTLPKYLFLVVCFTAKSFRKENMFSFIAYHSFLQQNYKGGKVKISLSFQDFGSSRILAWFPI